MSTAPTPASPATPELALAVARQVRAAFSSGRAHVTVSIDLDPILSMGSEREADAVVNVHLRGEHDEKVAALRGLLKLTDPASTALSEYDANILHTAISGVRVKVFATVGVIERVAAGAFVPVPADRADEAPAPTSTSAPADRAVTS